MGSWRHHHRWVLQKKLCAFSFVKQIPFHQQTHGMARPDHDGFHVGLGL